MVHAQYFDGRSSRARDARVDIDNDDLVIALDGQQIRYRLSDLQWPTPGRSAARLFLLSGGASLQADEDQAWSQLAARHGLAATPASWLQQSGWRIAIAVVLVLAIAAAGLRWGVPLAARAVLTVIPATVDAAIGRQTLAQLDEQAFDPSELSPQKQQALRDRLARLVGNARAGQAEDLPAYRLEFRASSVGPNAFALPGGSIVLTDELVELADGDLDMVMGVLAHEIGHVDGRHGMRAVSQSLLAASLIAVILGDTSSLITSAPLILGSLAYTRDLERQADDKAIAILQANGISPVVMAGFFRKILDEVESGDESEEASGLGLLFSSHPDPRERIRKFEDAAQH